MSRLEGRHRSLLRVYPKAYREARGEEMIATLLEGGAPDTSWPSAREGRDIVIGALRARS